MRDCIGRQNKRHTAAQNRWPVTSLTMVMLTLLAVPVVGQSTLTEFGMQYEATRVETAAGDLASLNILAKTLSEQDQGNLADGRQDALALLWGAIHFSSGRYDQAEDAFDKAADNTTDPDLEAAAAYRQVEAQTAALAGRDNAEVVEMWQKWLDNYPQSPLVTEAKLYLVWIHLRDGATRQATTALDEMAQQHEWLIDTKQYLFARAVVAFTEGDYSGSMTLLDGNKSGPAPVYLAALCHQRMGHHLQAAAGFQRVTTLFPGSPLHEHALFAKATGQTPEKIAE